MPDYDFELFLDSLTEEAAKAAIKVKDIDALSTVLSDLCDAVEAALDSAQTQMFQAVLDGRVRTLLYTDGDGVQSVRHVAVTAIWRCKNGKAVATTYDLDRQAPRSYRLDRIDKAIDGHVMLDEAWFA